MGSGTRQEPTALHHPDASPGVRRLGRPFHRDRTRLPRRLLRRLDLILGRYLKGFLPEEKRYWILVPTTGVAAGLFAVGFVKLLEVVQDLCWGQAQDLRRGVIESGPLLRWLVPTAAGAFLALAGRLLRRNRPAEGISNLIESLTLERGKLPLRRTILNGAVSITTVGAGASLGREGALIQTGAAFGSWLGDRFHLRDHHVKVLLACGAAGGIAAAYNVPIGASVFAMEVLLGTFALEIFGPIIICSVIATAISRALISSQQVYHIPPYSFEGWEIFIYALLGIFMGLVSVLFIRFFSGLDVLFRWFQRFLPLKPLVALAALGAAAVFFPDLLGNGYSTVNLVLRGESGFPVLFLLVLPLLKMFFTALCRTAGIPGGLFTPSIFVGALLGSAFGAALRDVMPWPLAPPGAYGVIGMGAILAGTMRAPITAILLVFEMTHDYSIILPLMSACIASTLVSRVFQQGTLYTEPLRRRGILLPEANAPTWLRQPTVREFTTPVVDTVQAVERFESIMDKFLGSNLETDRLYVVNQQGIYLGAISLHEIKLFFRDRENFDPVIAIDVLDSTFPFLYADDPISRAIDILAERDTERLPVLESRESNLLLGSLSKRQLLAAYRRTNLCQIQRV